MEKYSAKSEIWCPHINKTIWITIKPETVIGNLVKGTVTGCEKQNECESKGWCWVRREIQTVAEVTPHEVEV